MNRSVLLLLWICSILLAVPKLLHTLVPPDVPPSVAQPALPFEALAFKFTTALLAAGPWVAGMCLFVALLMFIFGEGPLARHEPLTTGMRDDRDIIAVRALLRRVRDWLLQQQLPAVIGPIAESIGALCSDIARQLDTRDPAGTATVVAALHKLLAVELATLVLRYQRVPRAQRLLRYLDASANDLLVSGLRAIDDQLRAVHDEMARGDLHELHVQTRYLELTSEPTSRSKFDIGRPITAIDPPPSAPSPAPVVMSTPLAPATMQTVQHQHLAAERERTGFSLLETVGVAAVTTAVIETLLDDAKEERDEERYAGGGGGFGGAGASGDWSDETNTECTRGDEAYETDSSACSNEVSDDL